MPCVCIDGDDVKAHRAVGELWSSGEKQGGRSNEFLLLAGVNGQAGVRQTAAASIAYFGKYQAIIVEHDQVDLAEATAEVLCDIGQALRIQEFASQFFGIRAYSSCVASNHDSSSAASGSIISGPSLMS